MENYDSEKEREFQERMKQKIEAAREFVSDEKTQTELKKAINEIIHLLDKLNEKAKYTELNKEEKQVALEGINALDKIKQTYSDAMQLIGHNLNTYADAYYFHVKKLAEEGNEDAMRVYEALRPLYEKANRPKGPEGLN